MGVNLKIFLQHIARGEQTEAEAMLKAANPLDRRALLTGKAIVKDYADETGRMLKGTALQLALGAMASTLIWISTRKRWIYAMTATTETAAIGTDVPLKIT